MLAISESLDALRGRFLRLKQGKTFVALAEEVGVSHPSLNAFARGRDVNLHSLRLIEAWCDAQEQAVSYAKR